MERPPLLLRPSTDVYRFRSSIVSNFDGLVGSLEYAFEGLAVPSEALDDESILLVMDVTWDEETCEMTKVQKTLREILEDLISSARGYRCSSSRWASAWS